VPPSGPLSVEPGPIQAHPVVMPDDIRRVEANGLRFAYLEEGAGPLVLLLHGFPDTARSWDHARGRIAAKGYRAVSPWLRGYAPTAIPDRDADLETIGRDVLGLIAALGETSAIVVGHDWGAAAAYAAASLEPARVKQLAVIGIPHPAALKPSPAKLWAVRHFIAYKLPGAARRFARDDFAALPALYKRWSPTWSPPAEEFAAVRQTFSDPASLDAAFGYYRQLRFRPQPFLRTKIAAPTVAFAGLDDNLVGPADYTAAKRMFTGDYVVEEMRGGHFMHREHPDEFAAKLLAHL
jgi:pimeloyl-ACP methyl ester carboxylesterase